MIDSYLNYVKEMADLMQGAGEISARSVEKPERPSPEPDAPVALLFSPHPDDECITGLLPLRLAAECGWRIVNVPVTHGSDPARQAGRHSELEAACDYLGWELAESPAGRNGQMFPSCTEKDVMELLQHYRPQAVFFPHNRDWNRRHLSTHRLLMHALAGVEDGVACSVVETEFWGAMDNPNLLVEGTAQQLGDLITALALHEGEVRRNPYHLCLPAWMIDNVRRGAERIGGQGGEAPDFQFGTLYRLSCKSGRELQVPAPRTLSRFQSPGSLWDEKSKCESDLPAK